MITYDQYCDVIRQVASMTLQQDLTTIMASCTRNGKLTRLTTIGVAHQWPGQLMKTNCGASSRGEHSYRKWGCVSLD